MPTPNAAPSSSTTSPRTLLWASVSRQLLHHALPDSRFHYDFLHFTPDFRGSEEASARVTSLPCYTAAKTLLVSSDASLEPLRRRALHDGKSLLVGTYRLRRGFLLLDPRRIGTGETEMRLAACLDGMEKPGVGRRVELAQLREEGWSVDLCVLGALMFNVRGVVVWEGASLFEVQWAMLRDIGVLRRHVPVVGVAHECQVVDEAACGVSRVEAVQDGEVQCDFVVTNERTVVVEAAVKPAARRVDFGKVDPEALINIPPLQELKGMRMMEQIMAGSGFGVDKNGAEGGEEEEDDARKPPSAEEQMGIDIVERLMQGLKS